MAGYKVCPVCSLQAPLDAQSCAQCGHQYRTQFVQQASNPTQSFPAQPQQGQQQGVYTPGYQPQPYQQPLSPGQPYVQPPQAGRFITPWPSHSPWAALLFSAFTVIGGQIYNRQYAKALLMFLIWFAWGWFAFFLFMTQILVVGSAAAETASKASTAAGSATAGLTLLLFVVVGSLPWVTCLVDAYRVGKRLGEGQSVTPWSWF